MPAHKLLLYFIPLLSALLLLSTPARLPAQRDDAATIRQLTEWLRSDPSFVRAPALRDFAHALISRAPRDVRPPDPHLTGLLRDSGALQSQELPYMLMSREELMGYLRACVQDKLTMLRAISLIARLVRRANIILVINGEDLTESMNSLHISDGLSLPSEHAAYYVYIPDQARPEPFQCRFLALYKQRFVHDYPRKLISAAVNVGQEPGSPLGPRTLYAGAPAVPALYQVAFDLRYSLTTAGLFQIRGLGLSGFKSILGAVAAMYVQNSDLVLETSRFHLQKRIAGYDDPANANLYAVHPW